MSVEENQDARRRQFEEMMERTSGGEAEAVFHTTFTGGPFTAEAPRVTIKPWSEDEAALLRGGLARHPSRDRY